MSKRSELKKQVQQIRGLHRVAEAILGHCKTACQCGPAHVRLSHCERIDVEIALFEGIVDDIDSTEWLDESLDLLKLSADSLDHIRRANELLKHPDFERNMEWVAVMCQILLPCHLQLDCRYAPKVIRSTRSP
jgi:hypothetical protein